MQDQREYWDGVADRKTFTIPFQTEEFQRFVTKGSMILDVGCGYGRTLNDLYQLGYHNLVGIDFSKAMIARGRMQYPYLRFRSIEGTGIDFPDESIDAVILIAVLTCNIKEEDQRNLIREIHRVLKPNGTVYVADFLIHTDEHNLARYREGKKKYGVYGVFDVEGVSMRHHKREYLENLLSDFEKLASGQYLCTTMNGNRANGYFQIARKR